MINFPENSKLWIYGAKRPIETSEQQVLKGVFNDFVAGWESHGARLNGSIQIVDDYFVVVAAEDDGNMCGRAQDAQVRLMKEIDEEFDLGLLDRMKLLYLSSDGIKSLSISDAKGLGLSGDTIVFDTMVNSPEGFKNGFKKELQSSWYAKLI
jgi:hypothetical protein